MPPALSKVLFPLPEPAVAPSRIVKPSMRTPLTLLMKMQRCAVPSLATPDDVLARWPTMWVLNLPLRETRWMRLVIWTTHGLL